MRIAVLTVAIALFACKKSGDDATPAASAAVPPVAAEPPADADAAPAAVTSASAETPESEPAPKATAAATTTATATAKTPKPDAGAPPPKTADNSAAYKSVMACCGALSSAAKKDPKTQNKYTAAAAVCSGIAQQVKKGAADASAARTLIRAQLHGVPVPGAC
jgi:hypothetical protein